MESEKAIAALATLDPLFALRYSATHRNPYNVVYRLTPAEAYRQGLVKKIEVDAVVRENEENRPYLRVDDIKTEKNKVTARLTVHKLMKTGQVKERKSPSGPAIRWRRRRTARSTPDGRSTRSTPAAASSASPTTWN